MNILYLQKETMFLQKNKEEKERKKERKRL